MTCKIKLIETETDYILWTRLDKSLFNINEDLILGILYIPPSQSRFLSDDEFLDLETEITSMCCQSSFKNKDFQNLLKSKKIYFFTTENPETKASIVERFQRTLKSRMWKYFTHHRTLRYVDVLPKLVEGYNHAYHRSIKRAPVLVTIQNEPEVSEILYGKNKSKFVRSKLKVGDYVRINKTKRTFDKGYLPNWTQELFKIITVVKT